MIATASSRQNSEQFYQQIEREFIDGSAIAPSLFHEATKFHRDLEIENGELQTPIHEALNWKYIRFGQQASRNLEAIFFIQESGECWQAKLSTPRFKDGKALKYETPVRVGGKAYLPPINRECRRAIASRYGCEVPPCGESFWDWLELHPEIEIIVTEGGKKALCLLSNGYVAIALTGVNAGYRTQNNGVPIPPELIPDLQRFALSGRRLVFTFDQDTKPTARRRVAAALWRTSRLLIDRGCNVAIARWQSADGKGVDDLIVNRGLDAWQKAYNEAKSLKHWYITDKLQNRLKRYKPTLVVNVPDLSVAIAPETFPDAGILVIDSDTGTGKTKLLAKIAKPKFVKVGHRRSLERNGAKRLGGHFINDIERFEDRLLNPNEGRFLSKSEASRKTLCFDSLLRLKVEDVEGGDLVLDEADQGLRHLLTSATCRKGGKRPLLLKHLEALVKAAKRVILLSATLGDREIDYICQLRGEMPAMVLQNKYQRKRGKCRFITSSDDSAIVAELLAQAKSGQRSFIAIDKLSKALALASLLKPIVGEDAIFEFNSHTSGSEAGQAFATDADAFFEANPQIKFAIVTPSGFTGLNLEGSDRFDAVYGIFYGQSTVTDDAIQALERVRESIPRVVWAAKQGRAYSQAGQSTNPIELKGNLKIRTDATASLLRNELRPEKADSLDRYEWTDNPHLNPWANYESDRNFSMANFRDCLQIQMQLSGYQLEFIDREADKAIRKLLRETIADIKIDEAIETASSKSLTDAEAKALETKDYLEPDEARALAKWQLANWYVMPVDEVQADDVLFDRKGSTRTELQRFENILFPDLAKSYDLKKIEQFAPEGSPATVWDFAHNEQERKIYEAIGMTDFLSFALAGGKWGKYHNLDRVQAVAAKARLYTLAIKQALNLTIIDEMSDTQIIGMLLRRIGLKTRSHRQRIDGQVIRVYELDSEALAKVQTVLRRRAERRDKSGLQGDPPPLTKLFFEGGWIGQYVAKNRQDIPRENGGIENNQKRQKEKTWRQTEITA